MLFMLACKNRKRNSNNIPCKQFISPAMILGHNKSSLYMKYITVILSFSDTNKFS